MFEFYILFPMRLPKKSIGALLTRSKFFAFPPGLISPDSPSIHLAPSSNAVDSRGGHD